MMVFGGCFGGFHSDPHGGLHRCFSSCFRGASGFWVVGVFTIEIFGGHYIQSLSNDVSQCDLCDSVELVLVTGNSPCEWCVTTRM